MAITFIQKPQKFTPSNNDIMFQVVSDSIDLAYFLVEVKDSAGVTISTLKLRPTPVYRTGAFFNLNNVLTSKTTIVKTDNLVEYTTDVIGYSVKVTAYKINTDGTAAATGDPNTFSGAFVYNAKLPIDAFSAYDYTAYVASTLGTGRFLTTRPTQSDIAPLATEYLYYMNDSRATKVVFKSYYTNGTVVSKTVALTLTQKMGRINISPLVLEANGVVLTNLVYYTVELQDAVSGVAVQPVYRYLKTKCSISNVQLFWKNDLGGVDSYLFKNMRESISNTKITAASSSYKLSTGNLYSNNDKNIFYPTDVNLQSETTSTYTLVSEYLTNNEARWITGVIKSKEVYVLLENRKLYPVQIKDNNASIQNTRYTSQLNQFEVSFTAPSSGTDGVSIQMYTGEEYFPYILPITYV